jgi:thiol:disulfide interchange protein
MILRSMLVAAVALAAALPARAASIAGPHVSVASVNDLTVPDHVFDEAGDADHAVDAAMANAARDHKLILVDLGADWCADCRILSAVMALPEVSMFLNAHYETAIVDVGRMNKNLQVPARFGIVDKLEAVPAILIVTPDGTLANRGHIEALVDARTMTPQGISDWLASWAR